MASAADALRQEMEIIVGSQSMVSMASAADALRLRIDRLPKNRHFVSMASAADALRQRIYSSFIIQGFAGCFAATCWPCRNYGVQTPQRAQNVARNVWIVNAAGVIVHGLLAISAARQ